MSLETVIKIGKFYRESKDSWKYHDQINRALNDVEALKKKKDINDNNIHTVFFNLKVIEVGSELIFDIDNIAEINDEDIQKQIYYLNFKTSKKDASKRYLFGDISYACFVNNKGNKEESGNYRMHGAWKNKIEKGNIKYKSSFWQCEEIAQTIQNPFVDKFRKAFRQNINKIESFLSNRPSTVLHFDFNGNSWHNIDDIIDNIDYNLTLNLVKEHTDNKKVVLNKYLYKSLGSVSPGFMEESKYKNKLFERDEIISLMYAGKATEKPLMKFGNIGILALPHSDTLKSGDIINFFEREKSSMEVELSKERDLNIISTKQKNDSLFAELIENDFNDSVKFDLIFTSIPKSPAGVFADLIEITDIEKSMLVRVHKNILNTRMKIEKLATNEFPNSKQGFFFDIKESYLKIFGDTTKEKKKYNFHLLKIIPQIYSDSYYEDVLLLPVFINKVEFNIREGKQSFSTLKYDLYFLINIQKNNIFMTIKDSNSYKLGKNLGVMAKQFAAWRNDCPIKSFEKSYVGNLSRRISSIEELIKFTTFINEKLIMHNRLYSNERQAYLNLNDLIKNFGNEKYNKYNCSLGFFESYYENTKKEDEDLNTEEIINQ